MSASSGTARYYVIGTVLPLAGASVPPPIAPPLDL